MSASSAMVAVQLLNLYLRGVIWVKGDGVGGVMPEARNSKRVAPWT